MAEEYSTPDAPKKKRNWKLIGGVIAGCFVLMCACLVPITRSGMRLNAAATATAEAVALANVPTALPTPTNAPTAEPSATLPPEPTATIAPTDTPAPTNTPEPTATEAPTVPPTDTPEPTATEPPTATPAPMVLSGTGQKVTDHFQPPSTVSRILFTHNGTSNFAVKLYNAAGDADLLVNEIGRYEGYQPLIGTMQEYFLEVDADGDWTATIEPLTLDDSYAAGAEGHGAFVSQLFNPTGAAVPYTFTHDGTSNFAVQILCAGGQDLVQNEIGPVQNEAVVRFNEAPCVWVVDADGSWTLRPK